MDDEVRADEWVLAREMLEDQRLILSNLLSAGDLIEKIACAARQASHEDEFFLCWEASTKQPGQARVSGVFRCPEDVFDQFFNGRTGYRAQYYLGPDVGEAYNRNVLDRLEPVVRSVCVKTTTRLAPCVADRESLRAPGAKVWFRERHDHYLGDSFNPAGPVGGALGGETEGVPDGPHPSPARVPLGRSERGVGPRVRWVFAGRHHEAPQGVLAAQQRLDVARRRSRPCSQTTNGVDDPARVWEASAGREAVVVAINCTRRWPSVSRAKR